MSQTIVWRESWMGTEPRCACYPGRALIRGIWRRAIRVADATRSTGRTTRETADARQWPSTGPR